MKKLFSISAIVLACMTLSGASAQQKEGWKLDDTYVVVIGDPDNEQIKIDAIEYFRQTLRKGHQQVGMPKFLITDKKSRAVFTIGGFVNFRTAYDMSNVIGSPDFVTYDIPMSSNSMNNQRLLMDASTSRLYFKSLIATPSGKPIEAYVETDFRGNGNSLRLREAYISWSGLTVGQTVTTFCDLGASFNTIDFEGPNAYTYGRNLMVQYKKDWKSGWGIGVAAEYPVLSATTGSYAAVIPQRVPDIPAYVQYAWNKGASHIRLSGILRTMFYEDLVTSKVENTFGWGAQLSGAIQIAKPLTMYGQFLIGESIAPYVQDLAGNGYDLLPSEMTQGQLRTPMTTAWLAGLQYNITPKMPMTVGYSQVLMMDKYGCEKASQYKLSQYVVANLFYNFSKSLWVGVEYLYGNRYNHDDAFGMAHRVQLAVQLNF